jgi:glucose/mannose transport system permease protein
MALTSTNPRYLFTPDRLPAVYVYAAATAVAALLGFFVYSGTAGLGGVPDAKLYAENASGLFIAYTVYLAKILASAGVLFALALFGKRALESSIEPADPGRRVNHITFAAVMAAAFLIGFAWDGWTSHSGVTGATFFIVLFGIAFTLLDMPFRELRNKLIFMAVLFGLFLLTAYLASSSDSWLPKVLGLLTVTVPVSLVAWMGPYDNQQSKLGSFMMILIALFVFVGGTLWTIMFSFTSIRVLPLFTPQEWWANFTGLANYTRLFNTSRWIDCPMITKIGTEAWRFSCRGSLPNVITYAVLFIIIVMILGFIIAVLMDQKIRAEGIFRTIYLYPFALSFIVTGHVWAWILSPEYGLQKAVRNLGWESFSFGWIADREMVMYAIVLAGVWQGTGFVMALMLAGLRGIDEEIWKAARIDGIPTWRTYVQIVLPMMKPVLVTTFVFVASGAIRIYDLVIATTDGGPGVSSDVPSRYIYQNFSANLGQSLAASTVMLVLMAIVLIPWIRLEFGKKD